MEGDSWDNLIVHRRHHEPYTSIIVDVRPNRHSSSGTAIENGSERQGEFDSEPL